MNIFSDYHHQALATSLQLLFEKRLGHKLFFPYGIEWFDSGNWLIGNPYSQSARNTALQFLTGSIPQDGTGIVTIPNKMTFEEFIATPIDIMIASYYDHIPVYQRLIERYHPNAKLIVQFGNEWPYHPLAHNLLSSTAPLNIPNNVNVVYYHQEFDPIFTTLPTTKNQSKEISTFVNALPLNSIFSQDWQDFLTLESLLPGYRFYSYGGGCRNACISHDRVIIEMRSSRFAVHFKEGGDGYGHIIHQLAATGTPVIFKGHQYKGKLAECFLEDGITGFDADKHSLTEIAQLIGDCSFESINNMSREIYTRFKNTVDFDKEEQDIRRFLDRLQ